jgi:cell division protein FtsL
MTHEDFEYAIKKDVRNNPIVREVDQARQQEMWRSVIIGVCLVSVVLFSAWQNFELLQHGYRVEQLQQERARELEINRHLRLEIETLRSPSRIERIATEQLNLVAPTSDEAIVVERVRAAPAPDRSVVVAKGEHTREQAGRRQ